MVIFIGRVLPGQHVNMPHAFRRKTHTSEASQVWGLQDVLFQIIWLLLVVNTESTEFGSERLEPDDPY